MFMRIHQSQPRRIVLDPMEQMETSGPGFFSENKVSLVSFASKKTPPFWKQTLLKSEIMKFRSFLADLDPQTKLWKALEHHRFGADFFD